MSFSALRPASEVHFDQISLGEVMLRLDPGEGRIRTARQFRAWEGGGEYNVARGLRRCFGQRTALVTAFADNEIGRLLEDFILQGGVDASLIKWEPYDGIGRTVRNGLNFTERGFGVRGAVGCSDRGLTAASQLKPGDFDWDEIFGRIGTRWFHTGGIFAALSETTAELVVEATRKAREHGVIVSYDLNYRPSLWMTIGGHDKAREVNRRIAPHADGTSSGFDEARCGFAIDPSGGHQVDVAERPLQVFEIGGPADPGGEDLHHIAAGFPSPEHFGGGEGAGHDSDAVAQAHLHDRRSEHRCHDIFSAGQDRQTRRFRIEHGADPDVNVLAVQSRDCFFHRAQCSRHGHGDLQKLHPALAESAPDIDQSGRAFGPNNGHDTRGFKMLNDLTLASHW